MNKHKHGYVFPLILLASLSIGFFTITLIQLQSSHRDQLMHLNSYQYALNLAYSVNVEVLSELRENQWANRFFKGTPVNRLNKKKFGGIYDLCVEDYDAANYTFNVKIRTNIGEKKNLFYWRQRYIPNMLDFTRMTLPIFFGEFAPEMFESGKKTELDKLVDEKLKTAVDNADKSKQIIQKAKKEPTIGNVLKEIGAIPPGKESLLKDGNQLRPPDKVLATKTSTEEKTPASEVLQSIKDVVEAVDSIVLPAKGKSVLTSYDLMIRDEPWGKVIGDIPPGTENIDVLGMRGDFFEVSYNGKTGYSHMNYVAVPGHTPSGVEPPRPPGAPPPL